MQASDLPEPARKMLLDQLRQQIGREQYDRLMDQAGEDAVLKQLVRAIESGPAPEPKRKGRIWPWIVGTVVVLLLMIFGGDEARKGVGQLFSVLFGIYWIIWIFAQIADWWSKNMPRF